VERLDAAAVLARVAEEGGPHLHPLRPLERGAVGAWLVRWPDGHLGVLTWAPPAPPGGAAAGGLGRAMTLLEVARAAGVPAPRYEAVIPLRRGDVAIVQELAEGRPVGERPSAAVVEQLIELAERRRGLLRGHPLAAEATSLYLLGDGPGFCLHGPLAGHDQRTRWLLERIEAIGAEPGADVLAGEDLVHFDYHVGNVLVGAWGVTAIVDWGGARAGDIGLDLALLAYTLGGVGDRLAERVERRFTDTTAPAIVRRLWAHVSLRLVDWALRHHPESVDRWLAVAPRYL
jgi:hypothetical protein